MKHVELLFTLIGKDKNEIEPLRIPMLIIGSKYDTFQVRLLIVRSNLKIHQNLDQRAGREENNYKNTSISCSLPWCKFNGKKHTIQLIDLSSEYCF